MSQTPDATGSSEASLPEADRCRICVGIATRGRAGVLADVVGFLDRQTVQPSSIILSCVSPDDVGRLVDLDGVTVLFGTPGLPRQRNAIMQRVPADTDIVVFFDDDFVPHPDWLKIIVAHFRDNPRVAAITGNVIADGIKGPGISFDDAKRRVLDFEARGSDWVIEGYVPYGCNMAFRWSAVNGLSFDERLVLYGWLEDRDFGAGLALRGWAIHKIGAAIGIHMGVKKGRVSGRQFGYSQVMNPIYLSRKGTMRPSAVTDHVLRNMAANLIRSLAPEPHVDRMGRLKGNFVALADIARGRLTPERAERL